MTRLSIIIPCLETDARLDDSLASVLQNRPDDCEVLVVHRGPYDDPYELAGEVDFIEAPPREGAVELLNRGLGHATAPFVHLLACGFEATDGWTERPLRRFEETRVSAVCPLVIDSRRSTERVCTGVCRGLFGRRRRIVTRAAPDVTAAQRERPLGPTLAAAFYRAESLRWVGGFSPAVGEDLADLDVALSLARVGLRCVVETSSQVIGRPAEPLATPYSLGQATERMYWRHAAAHAPLGPTLFHPLELLLDFLVQLPRGGACRRLLGRLSALREAPQNARHSQNLEPSRLPAASTRPATRRIDAAHEVERRGCSSAERYAP